MGERHITKRQENYAKLAKAIKSMAQDLDQASRLLNRLAVGEEGPIGEEHAAPFFMLGCVVAQADDIEKVIRGLWASEEDSDSVYVDQLLKRIGTRAFETSNKTPRAKY